MSEAVRESVESRREAGSEAVRESVKCPGETL